MNAAPPVVKTRYLVTARDGRIAKARQVKPFEVEVEARPHNLDKIKEAVCREIARFAKTKKTDIQIILPPDSQVIYGNVYSDASPTIIGVIRIDQLEEDGAAK